MARPAFQIAVVAILAFLATAPQTRASQATSRLVQLAFIGFGTAAVVDAMRSETCRSASETMTGAAIAGLGGAILGATIGSENGLAGAALGGVVGNIVGRSLLGGGLTFGTDRMARAGEQRSRDYAEQFEFGTCQILAASNVIRVHLLQRYLQVGRANCIPRDGIQSGEFSDGDWDRFIACNNNNNDEARKITLSLIGLNQATCRSIQSLGNELNRLSSEDARRSGAGSTMPFSPSGFDSDCDYSRPATVWGRFIEHRS